MSSQPVSFEESVPDNLKGLVSDWSSDVQTFKVRWSKAMMWIFLVSDTFIFGSFLSAYMAVRLTTTVPWPNTSEVFALHVGGSDIPLLLIAIMTFILISSSGTMAMAVTSGYKKQRVKTGVLILLTALGGLAFRDSMFTILLRTRVSTSLARRRQKKTKFRIPLKGCTGTSRGSCGWEQETVSIK